MAETKPWNQLPAEGPTEYAAFCAWLFRPNRPLPKTPELAQRYSWAERAQAYDAIHGVDDSNDPMLGVVGDIVKVAQLEARKLLDRATSSAQSLTPKEFALLLAWLTRSEDLVDKLSAEDDGAGGLESLSDQEAVDLAKLVKKLAP